MNNMVSRFVLERPFFPNGGYAFTAALPTQARQLLQAGAIVIVLENGMPLGPGNVQHVIIRNSGRGMFSLSADRIYFSASDNTDCNENNRGYSLAILDFAKNSSVYREAVERFASSDAELLRLIRLNSGKNNNVFLNFFGYFNDILGVLSRHKIPLPESAIELGSGGLPHTAVRFLLEGSKRLVANDIVHVQNLFEREFVQDLCALLALVAPEMEAKFKRITLPCGDKVKFAGLEVHDEQAFELMAIDGQVDFIFSTSVLEHVKQPRKAIDKMTTFLKPGGHVWHSIDLRDHRDFNSPLAFLEITADDYASVNTENRLRASDWLEIFQAVGFEVIECVFGAFRSASERIHEYSFTLPDRPWVDDRMRAKFTPPFVTKDLADLSALTIQILCRKPTDSARLEEDA
jgi:SAM-dependent methyltransferase